MKLLEFFGKHIDTNIKSLERKDDKNIGDEVFWFIIDHDRLHKDHFMPLAKKIKKSHLANKQDREKFLVEFMHMANQGCKEFYHQTKMQGKLGKLFPKEMREELAQRLYDHYYDDIIKDCYNLGL